MFINILNKDGLNKYYLVVGTTFEFNINSQWQEDWTVYLVARMRFIQSIYSKYFSRFRLCFNSFYVITISSVFMFLTIVFCAGSAVYDMGKSPWQHVETLRLNTVLPSKGGSGELSPLSINFKSIWEDWSPSIEYLKLFSHSDSCSFLFTPGKTTQLCKRLVIRGKKEVKEVKNDSK